MHASHMTDQTPALYPICKHVCTTMAWTKTKYVAIKWSWRDAAGPSFVVNRLHLHAFDRTRSPSTVHLTSYARVCVHALYLCIPALRFVHALCIHCVHNFSSRLFKSDRTNEKTVQAWHWCNQNDIWCPKQHVEQCLLCPSGKHMPCCCGSTVALSFWRRACSLVLCNLEVSVEIAPLRLLCNCRSVSQSSSLY